MKIFLSGSIQGTQEFSGVVSQDYREALKSIITNSIPTAIIVDPYELHPYSDSYSDAEITEILHSMAELAAKADLVLSFLPGVSMGTAYEMVKAHEKGVPIFTVSKLTTNWFIKVFSTKIFKTLEELNSFLNSSEFINSVMKIDHEKGRAQN